MAHRIERVNSLIRQELSQLLQRQVKDPRLDHFITVTEVDTSHDLKYAKVFVSSMGSQEEKGKVLEALLTASGFLHNELSKRLRLRHVPELSFRWDTSIEQGAHILELIDRVAKERGQS